MALNKHTQIFAQQNITTDETKGQKDSMLNEGASLINDLEAKNDKNKRINTTERSLAYFVKNAQQEDHWKDYEYRTYERYFENLLNNLCINKLIFKNANGNYAFPDKYSSFAYFLIQQLQLKGSLISKLISPQKKDINYQDRIIFYHQYLLWLKKELLNHLAEEKKLNPLLNSKEFLAGIIDNLPDEMTDDKIHIIAMTDDEFCIDEEESLYMLYNQTFQQTELSDKYLNMEDIVCLTRFIRDYINFETILVQSRLHAQIDEAVDEFSILGGDTDVLQKIADQICIINNITKPKTERLITEYLTNICPEEEFAKEVKGFKTDIEFHIKVLNGIIPTPSEDEDEDFEAYNDSKEALQECLNLYTMIDYDTLIHKYINDPNNSAFKNRLKNKG